MKAQPVRLLDVFVVGPVMMAGGRRLSQQPDSARLGELLWLFGLLTIAYNGRNYFRVLKQSA